MFIFRHVDRAYRPAWTGSDWRIMCHKDVSTRPNRTAQPRSAPQNQKKNLLQQPSWVGVQGARKRDSLGGFERLFVCCAIWIVSSVYLYLQLLVCYRHVACDMSREGENAPHPNTRSFAGRRLASVREEFCSRTGYCVESTGGHKRNATAPCR